MGNLSEISYDGINKQNIDITYTKGRMQSEVAREIEQEFLMGTVIGDTMSVTLNDIPRSVTLESAIAYFKEHAAGDYKNLYNRTSSWLLELLQLKGEGKKEGVSGGETTEEAEDRA